MRFIVYISLLSIMLWACTGKKHESISKKWKVVTTTGMIKDAVLNIAKDSVDVIALMGPGVDPHLYKATQGDLELLSEATIVFYSGLHLEGKMAEILERLKRTKNVIAVTDEIDRSYLIHPPHTQNVYDPHVWFDVSLWIQAVKKVGKSLMELDTLHRAFYEENMNWYIKQLDSLHLTVKERLQQIPVERRILITAHDAFGYFGKAYGIEVKGLQGISTMSDFGLRDVTDLIDLIVKRKVKAVFFETSVSEKSIRAVVEGCIQKGHQVVIGGSLYSDAMGTEGTPDGTYIGMVHRNVETIVNALK